MAHVIVIDDDPAMRKVIAKVLVEAGHSVAEAENGFIGLRVMRARHPDLVITDVLMPDKDGIETIREIRAEGRDVKILAISGGSRIGPLEFLDTAREFGADLVLHKPFLARRLADAVARLLGPD